MTQKTRIADLPDFDMARQLKSEEDIAAYITMVIEEGNAAELAHTLGVAAKARGMSEIAKATGLSREALYKALKPNAKPRFDTINRVCTALGVRLVAQPTNSH
jgi:probable addiction module antidote protein